MRLRRNRGSAPDPGPSAPGGRIAPWRLCRLFPHLLLQTLPNATLANYLLTQCIYNIIHMIGYTPYDMHVFSLPHP